MIVKVTGVTSPMQRLIDKELVRMFPKETLQTEIIDALERQQRWVVQYVNHLYYNLHQSIRRIARDLKVSRATVRRFIQ